ncbi:MAG: hypothetical protein HZY75_11650 [Nocardioidaceae bacterium]|nr:MAG: hypothetical protein HZY75_11650 [Nocardioidaceae bacterium]
MTSNMTRFAVGLLRPLRMDSQLLAFRRGLVDGSDWCLFASRATDDGLPA